jgi:hypothetical protein
MAGYLHNVFILGAILFQVDDAGVTKRCLICWFLANYRDDSLAEKALAVFSSGLVERGLAIARSCL